MVSGGQPQRGPLNLRGRGGGRGRGRGRDGSDSAAPDEPASSDGTFKVDEAITFLSEKYGKAVEQLKAGEAAQYTSQTPAWGAKSTMLEGTSPEAFLKMFSTALAAAESKKG